MCQAFEVTEAQTFGLINLVLVFSQTGFRRASFRLTKRTAIRPGSKLYLSNKQNMLNKDVTRIVQSLSRVRRNLASERKALLRGWQSPSLQWLTFVQNFSQLIAMITAFSS